MDFHKWKKRRIFVHSTKLTMTREDLQGSYSEGEALAIYNEVKRSGDFIGFALRFMYDEDYQVARNTFWGLTKATDKELSQLQPILGKLIDLAMSTSNSSVRRLSMNIIVRLRMEEEDIRTDFLDFCFDHAIDPEEYPGIQSLAIKLAWKMCSFYPELMDELHRMLEAMEISYYKPAVKSIRSRILSGKYKGE